MDMRRRIGPVLTPPPPYPWAIWTNGEPHAVYQGIDFDIDLKQFAKSIRSKACSFRKAGESVETWTTIDNDTASVRFQFVKLER